MQSVNLEKCRKFDATKYLPQDHPTKLDKNNELMTIFLNCKDEENFTVNGQPGLWKFYYEMDSKTNQVDTKHPCVLCVKKKNDVDPNSEACNWSSRFEYDLDSNLNVTTDRHKNHHTTFNHLCGNWNKGESANKSQSLKKHNIEPYLQRLELINKKMFDKNNPTEVLQNLRLHQISSNGTSFLQAAKGENYVLDLSLISAGQMFPNIPPQQILPYLNNQQYSAGTHNLGRKEVNDLLWRHKGKKVSVVLDESFIANKHIIMCLLVDPDSGCDPIPFKMYVKGTRRSNYAKLCARICFNLHKYRIEVVNFTGDGLQRQTDACSPICL
jgi:hypothetical protein